VFPQTFWLFTYYCDQKRQR